MGTRSARIILMFAAAAVVAAAVARSCVGDATNGRDAGGAVTDSTTPPPGAAPRASSAGAADRPPSPRPRAAPPAPTEVTPTDPSSAGRATDVGAGGGSGSPRPNNAPRAELPPRADVPPDATTLVAAARLRGWAAIGGVPRGLASEPGAVPARLQVQLSAGTDRALVFRISVEPEGAVRIPRDGLLRIESGRDSGMVSVVGLRSGPAVLVLTPVEGADAGAPPLRVSMDVRSMDEFPEPLLFAVAATDDAHRGPGALNAGDRQLRAVCGTDAGAIRLMRTGFRGFATEPTDVLVAVDDPSQILGPLPALLTIPAGATSPPEPLRIVLRDAVGRAVLRFRAGSQAVDFPVESVAAQWTAPTSVVVPVGARANVPLRLAPGTRGAPIVRAATSDASRVAATIRTQRATPFNESFVLDVRGVAPGDARVRVAADHRPDLEIGVTVVAAEIVIRGGRPVLLAPPSAAAGEIVLAVAAPGVFVADGRPAGARCDVRGAGTSEIVVRAHDVPRDASEIVIPVRVEGGVTVVRVTDRRHAPARLPYEIDADSTNR